MTLVDGSVKTTGVVAYSKFPAPTAAGPTDNTSFTRRCRARLLGDTSSQPAWLMKACRDGGEHEAVYAATAAGDHPDGELLLAAEAVVVDAVKLGLPDTMGTGKKIPQDMRDAKVAPHCKMEEVSCTIPGVRGEVA
ncbi:hypothetical protein CYMTET_35565 [Cymbomonas tetramitiformis]|uniref:Uncharacterized protein n=1 Tax=Cymbomonas tetramitiformis TaxID=36881 RepID=A0AAE0F904_9CHLO|nr:hypothetical protein CYMTET_35565 [Cymbomonas tetramitiformis]